MSRTDYEQIGKNLESYCNTYKVPMDYIFQILNDQKVLPMIRGKATEFNATDLLKSILDENEWIVQKLNLNPQPGTDDQDVSITHRRSGIIIKIESKNAVRGSMLSGKRGKTSKAPYCRIKCHKSRSNIKKADTGNDRYTVDAFDIVLSNLSNAIIKSGGIDDQFELIDKDNIPNILANHYNVPNDYQSLFDATSNDWRFVISEDIAEDGLLPRTPVVLLDNDPSWKSVNKTNMESALKKIVKSKQDALKLSKKKK